MFFFFLKNLIVPGRVEVTPDRAWRVFPEKTVLKTLRNGVPETFQSVILSRSAFRNDLLVVSGRPRVIEMTCLREIPG